MDDRVVGRGVLCTEALVEEDAVVKAEVVEAVLARLAAGETVSAVATSYGLDRKTVRAWRARGGYRPRQPRERPGVLAPFLDWLRGRAPEVGYNSVVLHRELQTHFGYTGTAQTVLRCIRPWRLAAQRPKATVRFETAPGQQAQVDFGQRRVWIGETEVVAHVFVCTLSYSRRVYAEAFPHERLDAVLAGHEHAFRHFGGVPAQIVVDDAKPVVLRHDQDPETKRHRVVWHPTYADFAGFYGFTPWAHWPYRPQTKGKTEAGVKYVQRNALAGRRFASWGALNGWLREWATTVADQRVHGTTHERPADRFAAERLQPVGAGPGYGHERVRHRVVSTDAMVQVKGSRYSVPVQYVGQTVTVRELLGRFEMVAAGTVIACHDARGRGAVVMDPAHYAGLLRVGRAAAVVGPPRFDPAYPASADVAVRDLRVYAALVEEGAA